MKFLFCSLSYYLIKINDHQPLYATTPLALYLFTPQQLICLPLHHHLYTSTPLNKLDQRHRQDLRRGPIQTAAHAPAVSDPSNEVPGRLLTTVLQHVKAAARPGAHRSSTLFSAVSTTTQSRRSEASQRRRCVAPERTRATLAGGSSGWPAELVRRRRSAASRYR